MIQFEKLKKGMILYDVHSYRAGNTTRRRQGLWKVYIEEVDTEKRRVLASWNGNKATWYPEYRITKYRATAPEWMKVYMSFERGTQRFSHYCPSCSAKTNDKKDRSAHDADCPHPKAKAWRKKNS